MMNWCCISCAPAVLPMYNFIYTSLAKRGKTVSFNHSWNWAKNNMPAFYLYNISRDVASVLVNQWPKCGNTKFWLETLHDFQGPVSDTLRTRRCFVLQVAQLIPMRLLKNGHSVFLLYDDSKEQYKSISYLNDKSVPESYIAKISFIRKKADSWLLLYLFLYHIRCTGLCTGV